MESLHPPHAAERLVWVVAVAALFGLAAAVRFGFDSAPKRPGSNDVAATRSGGSPAETGATPAQLLQTEQVARLLRDPSVILFVRDPGFPEAARLIATQPDLARLLATSARTADKALASPSIRRAMEQNADGREAVRQATEVALAVTADPASMSTLEKSRELARQARWLAEMSRVAPERAAADPAMAPKSLALNAEFARRYAEHSADLAKAAETQDLEKLVAVNAGAQRFLRVQESAGRLADTYAAAARLLAEDPGLAQWIAANPDAPRLLVFNPDAARAMKSPADPLGLVMRSPEATLAWLDAPEARRLLYHPDVVRAALETAAAR
jgi:hypothetical protein